ncbi:unnamed protein product, partial [Hapterophycus canaliculatus]
CWCGAGTPDETYLLYGELDDSACDVPCAGNSSENCGGSTIMSVYAFGDGERRQIVLCSNEVQSHSITSP